MGPDQGYVHVGSAWHVDFAHSVDRVPYVPLLIHTTIMAAASSKKSKTSRVSIQLMKSTNSKLTVSSRS